MPQRIQLGYSSENVRKPSDDVPAGANNPMNDNALTMAPVRSGLQGLPQRLVADGLVGDGAMVDAIAAAKERRVGVVAYLVEHNVADAREIAIAASQEFGAPLLDLDAINPDIETVRVVSDKLLRKHHVLPLVKRGKKLFLGISDPTNLHALDEVKFATGLSVEAVVVEEDKLAAAARAIARAGRHLDARAGGRRLRDGEPRDLRRRRRGRRRMAWIVPMSTMPRSSASSTRS